MRTKSACVAAVAACLVLLGGCVNFQVDEHSYQFNEATGNLSLRLLLLNAVRASKDYPLQFTKLSQYQGQGTSSASVSATLPIPTPGNGSISPKVDVKDGISELTLLDLNTAEAQEELKTTLKWSAYTYFRQYTGNRSHLAAFMLMTESITMSTEFHGLLKKYVKAKCNALLGKSSSRFTKDPRFPNKQAACEALGKLEERCGGDNLYETGTHIPGGILHRNETTSECRFNAFMATRLQLVVVGGLWDQNAQSDEDSGNGSGKGGRGPGKGKASDKLKPDKSTKGPGNTFNIYVADPKKDGKGPKKPESLSLSFLDDVFEKLCRDAEVGKDIKGKSIRMCISIRKPERTVVMLSGGHAVLTLRSPERIVRYLGDLIAAQSYGPDRFIPRFLDTERLETYTLLRVTRGIPPPGGAAVSVRSPDGEMFYVPRPDPDSRKEDISLETLSIVTEILNAAVSKKAIPEVTTLRVRSD